MRLHFPIPPFSPFWADWKSWARRNLITHILCFLFSLANQTVEIESLPSSSCHSKHSVNQTVKHYLPKVYKSIFYYYYYYFNFKNELYSKYDRNDTNLKFMKLKSNKDFVIIILKWNSPLGRLVLFCKI